MTAFGTRALVLRVGSTPTDYSSSVSNVRISAAESDSDFISFADAAAGGARDYTLALTMVQDPASTSLWELIWTAAGTDVPVEVWPNGRPGGGSASATQPKYTMTASVREPDGDLLGGEADPSTTAKFLTEVEWPLTAKPVKVVS